jgi:hypothetical protein
MRICNQTKIFRLAALVAVAYSAATFRAWSADANSESANLSQGIYLPTGLRITPTAAPGSVLQKLNPGLKDFPNFIAGGALTGVKSPDGKTLLVLVSGHNRLSLNGKPSPPDSNEYIFVFDISGRQPAQK